MENEDVRRRSFDERALAYEAERPGYPDALFDDLVRGLPAGARALEIGCGTGKATRSLVARGLRVDAVELGENLARLARETVGGAAFDVHVGTFEDWTAPEGAYDLAVSAQAYHWIDPTRGGEKLARALRPGAPFAGIWNVDAEAVPWIDDVYTEEVPDLAASLGTFRPVDEHVERLRRHVEDGATMRVEEVRRYPWTMEKTADAYVRLLDTYSDHYTLPAAVRDRLYMRIHAAIEARGGTITRARTAFVLVARPASV